MRNHFIHKSILIILMLFLCTQLFAQNKFTKEITRDIKIVDEFSLTIENSYGNIDIKNWNNNSISIKVIITVDEESEEAAQKILDLINIKISEDNKKAVAKTSINNVIPNKNFHIEYQIYLPVKVNIDINNSHGDVFIEEIKGKSKIFCKHGNISVNKFSNPDERAKIDINYGIAKINDCKQIEIISKHAELIINNAKEAYSNNKNSKLNFKNIGFLDIVSQYDSINIGLIDDLIINAKNSFFKINQLNSGLDIDIHDVGLTIPNISQDFKNIGIIAKISHLSLGISPQAYYSLEVVNKNGSFTYIENSEIKILRKGNNALYSGIIGKKVDKMSRVNITFEYGSIAIN
ncbi:hypothetical protein ACFLTI_01875 [Bacteroidota bacterium]